MADDISGRVLNPGSLIDYQDDSIVSRALLKEKAGSVTLFAFDEGQELSEHTTPYDALVEVIDGEAEIAIAGEPLRLNPGMMIVMPANVPHAVSAVARFKMILTMIRS